MPRRQKTPEELELLFFESLLEPEPEPEKEEPSEGTPPKKETSASRSREFATAYHKDPLLALMKLREDAISLVDSFEPAVGRTFPVPQEQINLLSREYDRFKALFSKVEALYDLRYREITNKHIDTLYEGEEAIQRPPSQMTGSLEPDYPGRRWNFVREGGDRKPPVVDWDTVAETVDDEVWLEVTDERFHPATEEWTERVPNLKKLLSLIRSGKISLEVARKILKPGQWQTPRVQMKLKQD